MRSGAGAAVKKKKHWYLKDMKSSCRYCGKIHDINYICTSRPKRFYNPDRRRAIRNSYRWQTVRKEINKRDLYLCRLCLEEGIITTKNLETHHIISIEDDDTLAYDIDNGITLCVKHHKEADRGKISVEVLKKLTAIPPIPKK